MTGRNDSYWYVKCRLAALNLVKVSGDWDAMGPFLNALRLVREGKRPIYVVRLPGGFYRQFCAGSFEKIHSQIEETTKEYGSVHR